MKKSTNFRYRSSWIDLRQDGMFPKDRIKGKNKRILGKWSRRKQEKWLRHSFKEENNE